ncbi:MAG: DUF72 domain-containing protein [Alphaproteobacteria bacterium]|nr:DUF72 domain-containing protein [Alphaproteobacteria bacterium]
MSASAPVRVGIGGWVFPPWRGTFYPPKLPQARELAHASRQVTAIEINGTFYGAQKPASFRRWHDDTPEDFVFSVKGPRYATHRNDLAAAGPSIDRFFGSGVLELRDKLGPILWQFPPFAKFDEGGFAAFFELLPRALDNRKIRHVVEVRHDSFRAPAFTELLRREGIAVAQVDDDKYPAIAEDTADFCYLRLRRCREAEATGYAAAEIEGWAEHCRGHAKRERDVFVYFINGAKVRAPAAAQALLQRLGG